MKPAEIAKKIESVSDSPLAEARLLWAAAQDNIEELIERRLCHEPVSKIIGKRGFWKDEFITTPAVLDPRPDTEIIIETVLSCVPERDKEYRILDIGTGSGCILMSLLDEYPKAQGVGIDISDEALSVARQNAKNRPVALLRRDFMQPDWIKGLGCFDLVVSNPPYIPSDDIKRLAPEVRLYDPILALNGGTDGFMAYRALAKTVSQVLSENGWLFLEIGIGQRDGVIRLFQESGWIHKITRRDYGGIDRILGFQKS